MAKKTNAVLEAELKAANAKVADLEKVKTTFIEKVLGYEGCYDGKVDFLSECGITDLPNTDFDFSATIDISLRGFAGIATEAEVREVLEEYLQDAINENFNRSQSYYSGDATLYVNDDEYTIKDLEGTVTSLK